MTRYASSETIKSLCRRFNNSSALCMALLSLEVVIAPLFSQPQNTGSRVTVCNWRDENFRCHVYTVNVINVRTQSRDPFPRRGRLRPFAIDLRSHSEDVLSTDKNEGSRPLDKLFRLSPIQITIAHCERLSWIHLEAQ